MLTNRQHDYTGAMFLDPGNRTPAPGALRVVQRFVNSADRENEREELETPAALERLLAEVGVRAEDAAPLTEADLRRALYVREALRELLRCERSNPLRARLSSRSG